MTKTLSMVSRKNHNINANKGFVIFQTFKLSTYFIHGFTLKMKSQSIIYLLNRSDHIYWISDLENEGPLIWVIWTSDIQECKNNSSKSSRAALEHGLHPSSERDVPRAGPNPGQM
jgi:hypothetical protein